MRRAGWAAVLTLAATGLAGCAGNTPSGRAPAARLYPFHNAVYYTAAEQRRLDGAMDTAIADCMRHRGYTYANQAGETAGREPDNPYGLLDPATVRQTGYGVVPAVEQDREHLAKAAATATATEDGYVDALNGTAKSAVDITLPDSPPVTIARDGCEARARAAVFGADWDRLYYTVQALSNTVIIRTQADPAVAGAVARWSACVTEAGFPAAGLQDLPTAIQRRAEAATSDDQTRAVARAELRTATADAGCQQRAGLRAVVEQAQARAETGVLTPAYRRDLDALRQREQAVLR